MIDGAASFGGGSRANTIVRHSSSSKKEIANSKLQSFRNVISSRVSARRFEPNISIPDNVWLDILRMTMVSSSVDLKLVYSDILYMHQLMNTSCAHTNIIDFAIRFQPPTNTHPTSPFPATQINIIKTCHAWIW